jgi:hypothetical protein
MTAFDGEAISRVDREFLAKLGDHPLMRNPLYSVPPPSSLLSNYLAMPASASAAAIEAAENARFTAALNWLLVNYAFCKSAFMGKGGVISLVDGEMGSIKSLDIFMRPYAVRDGRKTVSVVDAWTEHSLRVHIDKIQTRSDQPRPTFVKTASTSTIATGHRRTRRAGARSRPSKPSSHGLFQMTQSGSGCGTISPTRPAGRGCR